MSAAEPTQQSSSQNHSHPQLLVAHRPVVPDSVKRGLCAAVFFTKLRLEEQNQMLKTINAFFLPHFEDALIYLDDLYLDGVDANFHFDFSEWSDMSPEEWTRQEMTQNGVLLNHPGSTTPQLVVLHRPCIPENVRQGLYAAMSYMDMPEEGQSWMQRTVNENFRSSFENGIRYLVDFFIDGVETSLHLETTDHGIIHVSQMNSEYLSHFHIESDLQNPGMTREEIIQIPEVPMTQELRQNQPDCCICLEEFSEEQSPIQLTCSHIYHKTCLEIWLYTHRTCPKCRQTM